MLQKIEFLVAYVCVYEVALRVSFRVERWS